MTKEELKRQLLETGLILGKILPLSDGQDCLIYKAMAFSVNDEIVYIPNIWENGLYNLISGDDGDGISYAQRVTDNCYTGKDFVDICSGNAELAERLFHYCDCQHPISVLSEVDDRETDETPKPSIRGQLAAAKTAEQTEKPAARQHQKGKGRDKVDFQERAAEIARKYENWPMKDKIRLIAQAFGYTSGQIEITPYYGSGHGASDMVIRFPNGTGLRIGTERTLLAGTTEVLNEHINAAFLRYNPEIVAAKKKAALAALRKREVVDNMIAAQKGLKPYTVLNVELSDGTTGKYDGYIGWYYVTLAVDGKIRVHLETGLAHSIASGTVSETPTREDYFVAGGVKEADVDYVFNNVGFSSTSYLYSLPIGLDALRRAEKTLAELRKTQAAEHTQPREPSLRKQLTAAKAAVAEKPDTQQHQQNKGAR